MSPRIIMVAFAVATACAPALAQPPKEGERAPRPDSASNAAVGGWCDALTGEKKAECLREERRRQEERAASDERSLRGTCDALIGPEKDKCLRRGGTVEVGATPSTGATAREQ